MTPLVAWLFASNVSACGVKREEAPPVVFVSDLAITPREERLIVGRNLKEIKVSAKPDYLILEKDDIVVVYPRRCCGLEDARRRTALLLELARGFEGRQLTSEGLSAESRTTLRSLMQDERYGSVPESLAPDVKLFQGVTTVFTLSAGGTKFQAQLNPIGTKEQMANLANKPYDPESRDAVKIKPEDMHRTRKRKWSFLFRVGTAPLDELRLIGRAREELVVLMKAASNNFDAATREAVERIGKDLPPRSKYPSGVPDFSQLTAQDKWAIKADFRARHLGIDGMSEDAINGLFQNPSQSRSEDCVSLFLFTSRDGRSFGAINYLITNPLRNGPPD